MDPRLYLPTTPAASDRAAVREALPRGVYLRSPLVAERSREGNQAIIRYDSPLKDAPKSPMVAQRVAIGEDVLNFEIEFAFGCIDSYSTIIYADAFREGSPMRFISSHEWNATNDPELGTGRASHRANQRKDSLDKKTALLFGRAIAATTSDRGLLRYANVYNSLVDSEIQPEASVGFFALTMRFAHWLLFPDEDPEEDGITSEEADTGAWMAIDLADGVEVSSVYRGAVPGTTLKLTNGSTSVQAEQSSAASPIRAADILQRERTRQTLRRARKRADRYA